MGDTVDITKQNDINGIEKNGRNLSPRTIDRSIQMNFLDSILIATKGCPFTYSVSNNSKDNILLNPKAGISTLSMKELWNIDLIKCVDASPVVVLHDVNNLHSGPISTNQRNDVQEPRYNATVYIGSHSGLFVAVNLNDGRVIWKTQLAGRIEASCALLPPNAEKVFIGSHDFNMYALSANNGDILWKYETKGIIKCTP